jgi:hypothetical protein
MCYLFCIPAIFSHFNSTVLALVSVLVLAPCLTPGCPPWSRGEPKKWYGVPGSCAAEFEEVRTAGALLPLRRPSPPSREWLNLSSSLPSCLLVAPRPVCSGPPRRALLALHGGLSLVRWWGGR